MCTLAILPTDTVLASSVQASSIDTLLAPVARPCGTVDELSSCWFCPAGGHLNPAVSLGFVLARKISVLRFLCYVIAQMVGAITGSALVYAVRNKLRPLLWFSLPSLLDAHAHGHMSLLTM